jgi:hypothetical protein
MKGGILECVYMTPTITHCPLYNGRRRRAREMSQVTSAAMTRLDLEIRSKIGFLDFQISSNKPVAIAISNPYVVYDSAWDEYK